MCPGWVRFLPWDWEPGSVPCLRAAVRSPSVPEMDSISYSAEPTLEEPSVESVVCLEDRRCETQGADWEGPLGVLELTSPSVCLKELAQPLL